VPYRSHHAEPTQASEPTGDSDLLPAALILWIASVTHAVHAIAAHEPVSGITELAMGCAILLPLAVVRMIKKV
jgi:hypothetical protein